MAQDDNEVIELTEVVQEMQEAAKVIPFPGKNYLPLAEAASYIKSFVRADILKILFNLKEEAKQQPITETEIDRLIEYYQIH